MSEPISLLLPLPKPAGNHDNTVDAPGVVEWKPPHIDWHPWARHSAYEVGGAYSTLEPQARAERISQDLYAELSQKKGADTELQRVSVCWREGGVNVTLLIQD